MTASHLEFLVEEPSAEAFLSSFLPRVLGDRITFTVHVHQGKPDLLKNLEPRLRAYSKWLPENIRVIVLVDRDGDDCHLLKQKIETIAVSSGMVTRAAAAGKNWQVVNRIACEELEVWFLGDWSALRQVYPKLSSRIPSKAAFRDPDAITGGTWEALERILKASGYYRGGLRKVECARELGCHLNPSHSTSSSFLAFFDALSEAASP
jgi:hypothetical protein